MIATCLTNFLEGVREHGPVFAPMLVLSLTFPIVAAPFARAAYHRLVTRFMKFREVRSSAGRMVGASRTAEFAFGACRECG